MEQNNESGIKFGGSRSAGVAGVFGGALIAVGVTWIVLFYGQSLGQATITILIMTAVIGGIFISLMSVILGVALPTSVQESPWNDPENLIKWKEWKQKKRNIDSKIEGN